VGVAVTSALAGAVLALPAGAPDVVLRVLAHDDVRRDWADALAKLTPAERERAAGIAHPRRALAFVGGRSMTSDATAAGLCHVSLAHGQDVSVSVASATVHAGVDLAAVAGDPLDAGWPDGFSASEQRIIEALPPFSRPEAFARAWAAKEAIYKLSGSGAVEDFSAIAVASPALFTRQGAHLSSSHGRRGPEGPGKELPGHIFGRTGPPPVVLTATSSQWQKTTPGQLAAALVTWLAPLGANQAQHVLALAW
jgi:4'-phosphopantetheinyl transferase superfamily